METEGLEWIGWLLRACRAVRAIGWWVCLSLRYALITAVTDEASRLAAELAAAKPPSSGALRQSLRKGIQ